nr:DUF2971 domain-containing protein [Roseomonas marmotae]
MWRAYGGDNGVALVFNNGILMHSLDDPLLAIGIPVLYSTPDQFADNFGRMVDQVACVADKIHLVPRRMVSGLLRNTLRLSLLAAKHPGFHEEREWRIVLQPDEEQEGRLEQSTENIGGVPQVVWKLSFRDLSSLNRIIIGPTKFPGTIRDAFVHLLRERGHSDPESIVAVSDIPLRR